MAQSIIVNIPDQTLRCLQEVAHQSQISVEEIIVDWIAHTAEDLLSLYTIGHSDLSQSQLISKLHQHNISLLVDVRSVPFSRYTSQFNKETLQKVLGDSGIRYKYAGELLGGRPNDATVYKNQEQPVVEAKRHEYLERVDYKEVMKSTWYKKGVDRLIEIIRESKYTNERVVIMCSEGNPQECHRHHLIARSLVDPSVKICRENILVNHILKDGSLSFVKASDFRDEPQQLNLFGDM